MSDVSFAGHAKHGGRLALLAAGLLFAGLSAAAAQGVMRPGLPPPGPGPGPGIIPGNNRDAVSTIPGLMTAENPQAMVAELISLGYQATLTVDSYGDPMIDGSMGQSQYRVMFYGCTENIRCKYIQFFAGYDLQDGITLEKLNEWNRDKLWGQAYRDDENDPYVSVVYNMDGGVSKENFADTFDWFKIMLQSFEEFIGFRR